MASQRRFSDVAVTVTRSDNLTVASRLPRTNLPPAVPSSNLINRGKRKRGGCPGEQPARGEPYAPVFFFFVFLVAFFVAFFAAAVFGFAFLCPPARLDS